MCCTLAREARNPRNACTASSSNSPSHTLSPHLPAYYRLVPCELELCESVALAICCAKNEPKPRSEACTFFCRSSMSSEPLARAFLSRCPCAAELMRASTPGIVGANQRELRPQQTKRAQEQAGAPCPDPAMPLAACRSNAAATPQSARCYLRRVGAGLVHGFLGQIGSGRRKLRPCIHRLPPPHAPSSSCGFRGSGSRFRARGLGSSRARPTSCAM
jgi:hypothetical protein